MKSKSTLYKVLAASACVAAGVALTGAGTPQAGEVGGPPRPVKALIISMFEPESKPWLDKLNLTQQYTIPGLSPDFPTVRCNSDDVCQMTTGMGHANAAASVAALVFSGRFDLSKSYFLIAGIAGIDPKQGTLGTATWSRYLVEYGIAWELDARAIPSNWSTGYFGINTKGPGIKPPLDYKTEVFQLNEALLQKALALSKHVTLEDSDVAKAYRANYKFAPANQPPTVVQCDTSAGDTWWHGELLGKRAEEWTKLLTDGKGTYCTTQQEDNATYEALKRGANEGLLDLNRVAVLRTAANFDRPYAGQSAYDSLTLPESGGFMPSVNNLYHVGWPLIRDIVTNWEQWKSGVPR
ncbi:purine nucleoside permease [Chitinivorax sp. B]|uniref:purine-nucleoside phosphorylase n=1 Tax=Chitinivorax sp. B TaxID=2502235 RepID=UPI0010F72824|nr:purine nucleoside permease [Chitinivorax sp. B]